LIIVVVVLLVVVLLLLLLLIITIVSYKDDATSTKIYKEQYWYKRSSMDVFCLRPTLSHPDKLPAGQRHSYSADTGRHSGCPHSGQHSGTTGNFALTMCWCEDEQDLAQYAACLIRIGLRTFRRHVQVENEGHLLSLSFSFTCKIQTRVFSCIQEAWSLKLKLLI